MGELEPRGRRKPSAAMRALRGARDLYVRALRGLDRLVAAASPRRAGVGRPASRAFGAGASRDSDEEQLLRELLCAVQARRATAPSSTAAVGSRNGKDDAGAAASGARRRGATPLERIDEDAVAVVHPTS